MKYEKEVNPCIGYQRCPDGHKSGTDECRHGDEIWYEECCAYECDLPFCPEGDRSAVLRPARKNIADWGVWPITKLLHGSDYGLQFVGLYAGRLRRRQVDLSV